MPAALLGRARHVHVGSFFLQPGLAADLPALFRAARDGGATTSLDPNWDPSGAWDGGFAAALAATDIVLPNAEEAGRLTGAADVEAAARSLAGEDRTAVVKLGADGAIAVAGGAAGQGGGSAHRCRGHDRRRRLVRCRLSRRAARWSSGG